MTYRVPAGVIPIALASPALTLSGRRAPATASGPLDFPIAAFSGKAGYALLPRDQSAMYTSNSRATLVTADGEAVGSWDDAANSQDFYMHTASWWPTFHTDGDYQWVSFDGASDRLQPRAPLTGLTANMHVWSAYRNKEALDGSGAFMILPSSGGSTFLGTGDDGEPGLSISENVGTPTYYKNTIEVSPANQNEFFDTFAGTTPMVFSASSVSMIHADWASPWVGRYIHDLGFAWNHDLFALIVLENPSAGDIAQMDAYCASIIPAV